MESLDKKTRFAKACDTCKKPFGLRRLRHTCKRCSKIICSECTKERIKIVTYDLKNAHKVCFACEKEHSFQTKFTASQQTEWNKLSKLGTKWLELCKPSSEGTDTESPIEETYQRYLEMAKDPNAKNTFSALIDADISQGKADREKASYSLQGFLYYNQTGLTQEQIRIPVANVLNALCVKFPSLTYSQRMILPCVFLLSLMDEESAFWTLTHIISNILPTDFYGDSLEGIQKEQFLLTCLIQEKLGLEKQFIEKNLTTIETTVSTLLSTLLVNCVNFEVSCEAWNIMLTHRNINELRRVIVQIFKSVVLPKLQENPLITERDVKVAVLRSFNIEEINESQNIVIEENELKNLQERCQHEYPRRNTGESQSNTQSQSDDHDQQQGGKKMDFHQKEAMSDVSLAYGNQTIMDSTQDMSHNLQLNKDLTKFLEQSTIREIEGSKDDSDQSLNEDLLTDELKEEVLEQESEDCPLTEESNEMGLKSQNPDERCEKDSFDEIIFFKNQNKAHEVHTIALSSEATFQPAIGGSMRPAPKIKEDFKPSLVLSGFLENCSASIEKVQAPASKNLPIIKPSIDLLPHKKDILKQEEDWKLSWMEPTQKLAIASDVVMKSSSLQKPSSLMDTLRSFTKEREEEKPSMMCDRFEANNLPSQAFSLEVWSLPINKSEARTGFFLPMERVDTSMNKECVSLNQTNSPAKVYQPSQILLPVQKPFSSQLCVSLAQDQIDPKADTWEFLNNPNQPAKENTFTQNLPCKKTLMESSESFGLLPLKADLVCTPISLAWRENCFETGQAKQIAMDKIPVGEGCKVALKEESYEVLLPLKRDEEDQAYGDWKEECFYLTNDPAQNIDLDFNSQEASCSQFGMSLQPHEEDISDPVSWNEELFINYDKVQGSAAPSVKHLSVIPLLTREQEEEAGLEAIPMDKIDAAPTLEVFGTVNLPNLCQTEASEIFVDTAAAAEPLEADIIKAEANEIILKDSSEQEKLQPLENVSASKNVNKLEQEQFSESFLCPLMPDTEERPRCLNEALGLFDRFEAPLEKKERKQIQEEEEEKEEMVWQEMEEEQETQFKDPELIEECISKEIPASTNILSAQTDELAERTSLQASLGNTDGKQEEPGADCDAQVARTVVIKDEQEVSEQKNESRKTCNVF